MNESLKINVVRQRQELEAMLRGSLARVAADCAAVWPGREALNRVLAAGLRELPYCTFLYALDAAGVQVSDNASHQGLLPEHFGRDRSRRPYLKDLVPARDMLLSPAYLSLRNHRPSITAIQLVRREGRVVGFLGADFDLRRLPLTRELYPESSDWRQTKGDPVIRGQVFQQVRSESALDRRMDDALGVLEELYTEHGMFHCSLHFSSSRATIWLMGDPYRYRMLEMDALGDPDICLAYPIRDYPADAMVPAVRVGEILRGFRTLRLADPQFYLRSGSLNLFNGMVRLTFSCDGTHHVHFTEFLGRGVAFWGGGEAG